MNRRVGVPELARVLTVLAAMALAVLALILLKPVAANAASTLPAGFQEEIVFNGLSNPTNLEFSEDGRIFVAEKSGLIKVYDNVSDTTPTTFADLRTNVYNFWDRGLLGLALDPDFPTDPYVYVLYAHDAAIGGTAPRWGAPGVSSDPCPDPPGATGDGCVVSGRLSRLQADVGTNTMTGSEQVLIEDWCQQYPSHSVGDLAFGADGALYVSGGDGAAFHMTDYGQDGNPRNPCGDPPGGVSAALSPPTAEGGALRSQDLRTSGDPVSLDGTVLRVNPDTGAALPDNPLIGDADPNAKRVIAYGLRNPFRFTVRPGTSEVWTGDVGWNTWEEVNRVANPTDSTVENFGWPCYEGTGRQAGYDAPNLNICENLYSAANAVTNPYFAYKHSDKVVPGETCGTGSSSPAGAAFYEGGSYPGRYDGALFFADYSRECIWVMEKGTNGLPDPSKLSTFVASEVGPVDLEIGAGGDLFYVDLSGGTIRRVKSFAANQPPVARATADPTNGPAPLEVDFDASSSSDLDGDALSYAWDLDGDGAYDDSTAQKPSYTYDSGDYDVGLRVSDARGASDTLDQPIRISSGNTPPSATVGSPLSTLTWKVGDEISFSGSATDEQDGSLGPSKLSWSLILHHCHSAGDCHEHPVQDFPGVADGSFVAPDHDYPSHLELRLTATDSGGLTDTESLRLDPKTVELSFRTTPAGLGLVVGSDQATTPFSRTVIVGSTNSVSAPSPQTLAGATYGFGSWSDGGTQTRNIVAPASATTYTAVYQPTDATSPRVSSTNPGAGKGGVAPGINVRATFSEAMKAETLTGSTFTLVRRNADGTTTPVGAELTYDAAAKKAILDPTSNLRRGATHVATVTAEATDLAGNSLDQDPTLAGNQPKRWSFTVKR